MDNLHFGYEGRGSRQQGLFDDPKVPVVYTGCQQPNLKPHYIGLLETLSTCTPHIWGQWHHLAFTDHESRLPVSFPQANCPERLLAFMDRYLAAQLAPQRGRRKNLNSYRGWLLYKTLQQVKVEATHRKPMPPVMAYKLPGDVPKIVDDLAYYAANRNKKPDNGITGYRSLNDFAAYIGELKSIPVSVQKNLSGAKRLESPQRPQLPLVNGDMSAGQKNGGHAQFPLPSDRTLRRLLFAVLQS